MRQNPSAEGSGSLQKNIERTVQTSGFRKRGFRPSPWATKASLSGARCQAHAGREFGSLTRLAKRVKHKPDESFENSFIPAARLGQTDLNPKPSPVQRWPCRTIGAQKKNTRWEAGETHLARCCSPAPPFSSRPPAATAVSRQSRQELRFVNVGSRPTTWFEMIPTGPPRRSGPGIHGPTPGHPRQFS